MVIPAWGHGPCVSTPTRSLSAHDINAYATTYATRQELMWLR
jgi:hypothetical protein